MICRLDELPPCLRTTTLLSILAQLALNGRTRLLTTPGYRPAVRSTTGERIDLVCNFLHREYHREIRLEDIAEVASMSPAALSRFFHRTMGRTLTAYLREIRVGAACALLAETDLQVAEVAQRCGYRNISNFNRRFREVKQTSPREYRSNYLSDPGSAKTSVARSSLGR